MKDLEIRSTENTTLREQLRDAQRVLVDVQEALKESQESKRQLVEYINKISVVGTQFQKANIDETLHKLLNKQNIEINDFKVTEAKLKEKIHELEGSINIMRENYEVLRS